jgi:hypothetical protein
MSNVSFEISFYGPFVHVLDSDIVTVVGPRCEGHNAYVQTDAFERALNACGPDKEEACIYALLDSSGNQIRYPGKADAGNGNDVIVLHSSRKSDDPEPEDCAFQVIVPRPDFICGLIPDPLTYIEYDQPNPSPKNGNLSTGLRFHYSIFGAGTTLYFRQIQGPTSDGVDIRIDITADGAQTHVPLMIHYSGSGIFDSDHQDAEECFMNMRALFPPLGAWKVDFDDQAAPHFTKRGGDCKASSLVFRNDVEAWNASREKIIKRQMSNDKSRP